MTEKRRFNGNGQHKKNSNTKSVLKHLHKYQQEKVQKKLFRLCGESDNKREKKFRKEIAWNR